MAKMIVVTTTPRKQGTITTKEFSTLMDARYAVQMLCDRHMTQDELRERAKNG